MDGLFKWPYLGCMFSPCVLRIPSTQPAGAQLFGRLSRLACPRVNTHTHNTHPNTSIRVLTLMSLCVRHRKSRFPAFFLKMALTQHLINAFSLANREVLGNWICTATIETQRHMILCFAVTKKRCHTVSRNKKQQDVFKGLKN